MFYDGSDPVKPEVTLRLSDSFVGGADPDIEVRVHMINIGRKGNHGLVQACQPLQEYVWTVERIRYNMVTMDALQAVDEVIENMPDGFVIKPYLLAHKAEVRDMLLTEYNEAEAMELFREEGREEGREETLLENLASVMRSLGCTAERALDILDVPAERRDGCLVALRTSASCQPPRS